MTVVQRELEAPHPDNDGFVNFISVFGGKAKRELAVTEAMNKQMMKKFDRLWVTLGYELDGRNDKLIAEFWTTLNDFKLNLHKSRENNEKALKKQQEQEERARTKAEAKAKRQNSQKKKGMFDLMDDARKGSAADVIEKQKKKLLSRARGQARRGVRRKKR